MYYTTKISSSIGVDVSRSYITADDVSEVTFITGKSVDGIYSGEGSRLDWGLKLRSRNREPSYTWF